jgi:trk system potassium uptake protein TrkA
MRIVIVGAGQVGSSIAASLAESHEIVVVDIDGEKVDALQYSTDVLGIEGDGASLETLREAGIDSAEMVIASTDRDETNIVTCGTVQSANPDCFTIARVKHTNYLDTWQADESAFGVDFMVGTNLLTAEMVVRVIGLPGARDVSTFADGTVEMAEFSIPADSPIADQTVEEADRFDSLTFAAVLRDGDVTIPTGQTVLEAGVDVVVIGSKSSVHEFGSAVAPDLGRVEDVLIIGGGDIGYLTARLLEERDLSPRLIEQSPERARELAEELPGTTVLQSDATDQEFLEREHVADADTVVAALDADEKNLLVGLLAKRLGADRAVAVVDDGDYVELFEAVGIDVAVNPREVTAEEITRFTREWEAQKVALIESDRAEVVEIEVTAESVLVDRPIRDAVADLPEGVVIGAITRDGDLVIPRGDTEIQTGDSVVVFVDTCVIDEATQLL